MDCENCTRLEEELKFLKKKIKEEMRTNPHKMDRSKVMLLSRIGELNRRGYEWVKIQQDEALIKESERARTIQCDAVHASRLKWFGLLELKDHRTGEYKINNKGIEFLKGKLSVPKRIWCLKGVVIESESERVFVSDVRNVILNKKYWDDYPSNEPPLNQPELF